MVTAGSSVWNCWANAGRADTTGRRSHPITAFSRCKDYDIGRPKLVWCWEWEKWENSMGRGIGLSGDVPRVISHTSVGTIQTTGGPLTASMRVSESFSTSHWQQNRSTRTKCLKKACPIDPGGPGPSRNCARSSALGQFRPDTLRKSWGKFPSSARYATLFQICFCLDYHCQTRCQWWGNRRAQGLLLLLFPPKSCLLLKK